jgi:hypothetical protein
MDSSSEGTEGSEMQVFRVPGDRSFLWVLCGSILTILGIHKGENYGKA